MGQYLVPTLSGGTRAVSATNIYRGECEEIKQAVLKYCEPSEDCCLSLAGKEE